MKIRPITPGEALLDYILSNTVKDENECLIWQGTLTHKGYARLPRCKMGERVHRVVMELIHGPLGDKLACHTCDVKACVNPDHLYVGTWSDNNKDSYARGRQPSQVGRVFTAETRAKMSAALRIRLENGPHPRQGKTFSAESRAKMRASRLAYVEKTREAAK